MLATAYLEPPERIFPWFTSYATTHAPKSYLHIETIQMAGWQSNINLSHLKGYLDFYFDFFFLRQNENTKLAFFNLNFPNTCIVSRRLLPLIMSAGC